MALLKSEHVVFVILTRYYTGSYLPGSTRLEGIIVSFPRLYTLSTPCGKVY